MYVIKFFFDINYLKFIKVSCVKGSSWYFSRYDCKVYCKGEECSERIFNFFFGIRMKMKYKVIK